MNNVIVLNADNTYIGSISWQASIVLLYKGKVEMVKATDRVVSNVTKSVEFIVPKVVRLIRFVRSVYKRSNVPYSKRAVFIRDKYTCQLCGKKLEKRDCTVDHVYPKALGGKTEWANCVCSCTECNNIKGDLPLGKGDKLVVGSHVMKLRKRPQVPSVGDFIRMKTADFVIDDIL